MAVGGETAVVTEMWLGALGLGLSLTLRRQGLQLSGVGMAVAPCGVAAPLGSSEML